MDEIEKRYDKIISNDNKKQLKYEISQTPFRESAFKYLKILQKCNALLIGEETGGAKILNPAMPFKLSETQSTVSIPANFNIDNSSAGRNCKNNKDGLIPDIKITHSINNLINGIDEDYEAAINN